MSVLMTSIEPLNGGVRIDWSSPHDGFEQITKYLIEIKDNLTEWHQQNVYCSGADPTILYCIIPMNIF